MDPNPPIESEVRLYRASETGLVELARLNAVAPPRVSEGALHAPEIDENNVGGMSLFAALVQGGSVVDFARLVFGGGELSDPDGGSDCYSSDPSTGDEGAPASRSRTDEKVGDKEFGALSLCGGLVGFEEGSTWEWEEALEDDGDLTCWEEEILSNKRPEKSSSTFWKSGDSDLTSDEELDQEVDQNNEEENQTSIQIDSTGDEEELRHKLDQEVDQNNEENQTSIQINLRLWPAQKHAVIKIFCGGKWVLTKDCGLIWLKLEDVHEPISKVDFGAPFAAVLGFRNTSCIMDFEGSSPMHNDLLIIIKPSIRNFQILKVVGGHDACRVFKCLFMGSKCALKALTQKDPYTSEPREIEIISNLKGPHVMAFYQAWTEPWSYKGRPQKDYLFMHLEFCPSTLTHALLSKYSHWFPNKWNLFEEIVRSVCRLHEDDVVHRDLKPDNVFFNSERRVLIGDFGDACVGRDELGLYGGGTPKFGTKGYFAPEVNSGGKITKKVDIYSLGVILFELFAMIKTGLERSTLFPNLSKEGPPDSWGGDFELYGRMTALEPNDRPSAAEVLDYIRQYHSEG